MFKKLIIILAIVYLAIFGWFMQIRFDQKRAEQRVAQGLNFPVLTTKANIAAGSSYNNQTLQWDSTDPTSYHHTYVAADIHVAEGTSVVAAKGGEVVYVRNVQKCDKQNFPIVIIRAVDNFYYLYSHLRPGSIRVSKGESVEGGSELAQVGSADCAQGSAPHLHLDISRVMRSVRGGFWGQVMLIDPQPALIEAYQELPEK